MKRFLFLMISILFAYSTYAQQESEHLTFKGVPIDGSLASFTAKLKAEGFKMETIDGNAALMRGDFSGETCDIAIYSTENARNVYRVMVVFPETSTWASLESDYNKYKSSLTKKYGKPTSSTEKFLSPYISVP